MQAAKAFNDVFPVKRLHFHILAVLLTIQIHHGSSARWPARSISYHDTKDETQYIQFWQLPIPSYPDGDGFARGSIDLGGIRVYEAQYFTKVWSINQGGYDDSGTSFYEPAMLPPGYNLLGHFSQPNAKSIMASVLVAQDTTGNPNNSGLAKPVGYTLVWCSEGVTINKDGEGYIWLPIPPNGYKPVGHIVTKSRDAPSVDVVRVVREDFTALLDVDEWIWGNDQFNINTMRPFTRGVYSLSVPVGTFMAIDGSASSPSIVCLRRAHSEYSSMPNIPQVQAMIEAYSPLVYFHADEEYLPSTVDWFFENGALLYQNGQSNGEPISPQGTNLPMQGSIDDYYIDLPSDGTARDRVKRGDLQSAKAYVHVKPALGATYTDLAVWLFYPFNGPIKFQFGFVTIRFKTLGEHVGDWEHLTLRVDNFNGALKCIYLSEHDKGTWINAVELEYDPVNKPVVYSSLHGHALYSRAGHFLHGKDVVATGTKNPSFQEKHFGFGVRNDTGKGNNVMDIRTQYEILGNSSSSQAWLFYPGRWGPKRSYTTENELDAAEYLPVKREDLRKNLKGIDAADSLPVKREDLRKNLKGLIPKEVLGEEGPQGPMMKENWFGDERV